MWVILLIVVIGTVAAFAFRTGDSRGEQRADSEAIAILATRDADVEQLNSEIVEQNDRLMTANSEIESLKVDIGNLENGIKFLETEKNNLEEDKGNLQNDITNLEAENNDLLNEISNNQSEIDRLEMDNADLALQIVAQDGLLSEQFYLEGIVAPTSGLMRQEATEGSVFIDFPIAGQKVRIIGSEGGFLMVDRVISEVNNRTLTDFISGITDEQFEVGFIRFSQLSGLEISDDEP
jgi:hypothetical protein